MRLVDLLRYGTGELQQAGVEEYELDAMLLLQHCSSKTRSELFLAAKSEVPCEVEREYLRLLHRRKRREPVAYIIGEREFWSLPFHVTPDVLIPRPETEFLLDRVLALTESENLSRGAILDLCCGSGVIAAVLAHETGHHIIASDISAGALEVARKNIHSLDLGHSVHFVRGSLFACFAPKQKFSLVVSNPPYVSSAEVAGQLAPEVAEYEPHLALDGGDRGMEIIKKIRIALPTILMHGGQCFLEIGADQGDEVLALFQTTVPGYPDFRQVEILPDYAGRDRVMHARLAGK